LSSQNLNGVLPPTGFRIVRDKTTLERELSRKAHTDLQRKKDDGSSDHIISYVNEVPSIVKTGPKNMNSRRGRNHRPSLGQLLS